MKSLILKDLYAIRFQLTAGALLLLLPYGLLFLAGVGMSADGGAETSLAATIVFGVLSYMTVVVFSSFFLNTVADDIRSGWARFQRTLPLTAGQIIGAKLLASLVLIAVLVVISILLNLVPVFMGNADVELMLAFPFVFGCLQVMALMPIFPLSMRFGIKTANLLYCVFTCLAAAAAAVCAFMVGANDIPAFLSRLIFYGLFPLIAALVTALSYHLGKRALENSEG